MAFVANFEIGESFHRIQIIKFTGKENNLRLWTFFSPYFQRRWELQRLKPVLNFGFEDVAREQATDKTFAIQPVYPR